MQIIDDTISSIVYVPHTYPPPLPPHLHVLDLSPDRFHHDPQSLDRRAQLAGRYAGGLAVVLIAEHVHAAAAPLVQPPVHLN